jgi:SRSO17 transposase
MRAEAAGDPGPWRQQALLGRDRWDAEALRDLVREYVVEHLADDDAVLVALLHGSTSRLQQSEPHLNSCDADGLCTRTRSEAAASNR